MSTDSCCKGNAPLTSVGKALAELKVAQDLKAETAFDFEQAIRKLVAAENRLHFARIASGSRRNV